MVVLMLLARGTEALPQKWAELLLGLAVLPPSFSKLREQEQMRFAGCENRQTSC
jgi:hypothetical protein